jgi:hypothetical protein
MNATMKKRKEAVTQIVCLAGIRDPPDEPKGRSVRWKAGLMILAVLPFIFALRPRLVLYLVEEALTVLLGIAVILTLTWITLTALLLLWQGASLVFLHLKRIIRRGTSTGDRPLALHRR